MKLPISSCAANARPPSSSQRAAIASSSSSETPFARNVSKTLGEIRVVDAPKSGMKPSYGDSIRA